MIIVTSSFTKSFVFKMFPVHKKTPPFNFQIPPGFFRNGLVSPALGRTIADIKLRFKIVFRCRVDRSGRNLLLSNVPIGFYMNPLMYNNDTSLSSHINVS